MGLQAKVATDPTFNRSCRCRSLVHPEYLAAAEQAFSKCLIDPDQAELSMGRRMLAQLRHAIDDAGLPAHCLPLEITERAVMRDPETSLELLQELRHMGVLLAIDAWTALYEGSGAPGRS